MQILNAKRMNYYEWIIHFFSMIHDNVSIIDAHIRI